MIINYYLRKSKIDKNGLAPIYAKAITVNGKIEKSTGIKCEPMLWDCKNYCIKDQKLNQMLSQFKLNFKPLIKEKTTQEDNPKQLIKNALKNFEEWNDLKIKEKGTQKGDKNRMKLVRTFFMQSEHYHCPDDIDSNTAARFIVFLRSRYDYSMNTLHRQNKFLKMFTKYCQKEGITEKNKVEIIVKHQKPKEIKHLTEIEINMIRHTVLCERLEKVRDVFIFACNTGLAFCDLSKLQKKHVHYDQSNRLYIRITRNKTETECIIPLNQESLSIWNKYNKQLPIVSYQKYNEYLKEVAEISGIDQHISTHTARRTCGMILLNKGLGYDLVAKILGHADIRTTKDYYARFMNETVLDTYFKLVG